MTQRVVDSTKQTAADNNLVGGAVADPVALKAFLDDMALKINQIGTDNGDLATLTTTSKITAGALNELLGKMMQKVSGGAKLQSGLASVTSVLNAWASVTVTFPVAFADNNVRVFPGYAQGQQRQYLAITGQTATGFTLNVYNMDLSGTSGVFWIAVGN